MPVGLFSGHSPPLGTQDETFLDEERLVDFLEGSGVFAYGGSYGVRANGTSLEGCYDRPENLVVDGVQSPLVDL